MPIYEYQCNQCGIVFERLIRRISLTSRAKCEKCGSSEVERMISNFAFSRTDGFKGNPDSGSSCSTCSHSNCSTCK